MRTAMVVMRGIACLLLLLAGCDTQRPVTTASLAVRLNDVFIFAGGSPIPAAQVPDATIDELLLNRVSVPLGRDIASANGCKELTAYWVPTRSAEVQPTTNRVVTLCAEMGDVTLGTWNKASATLKIYREIKDGLDSYRAVVDADKLVTNSLYSIWISYIGPDGRRFAIAPLGGLPNLLFPDSNGHARYEQRVPFRMLRQGSALVNALSTTAASASPSDLRITAGTQLLFELYYHSTAQSNGNATPTTRQIPRGRVAVVGAEEGVDFHIHLSGALQPLP